MLRRRRPSKRTVLILVALLLLVGITVVVWWVNDWPPPRLLLKYGFPPTGGPTGRTKVFEGIEFVELSPGYARMGSHERCREGDLLGRICQPLGLEWGRPPRHSGPRSCPRWEELPRPLGVARTKITNRHLSRIVPEHRWDEDHDRGDWTATRVNSWWAAAYCARLAERSGVPLRLPTEEEWDWACRAGSGTEFCFGRTQAELERYVAAAQDAAGAGWLPATEVPNPWGLRGMHSGVGEWCDRGLPPFRDDGIAIVFNEPPGVLRGGCRDPLTAPCQSTHRPSPAYMSGIRPVFTPPEDE